MAKSYLRAKKVKMATRVKMEQLDQEAQSIVTGQAEPSVFENIPQRPQNFEALESRIKEELEVEETEEATEELPQKVYSIMTGDDDDEFYTYTPPLIFAPVQSLNAYVLSALSPFKKGIVSQNVLGEDVEVYYETSAVKGDVHFPMFKGVLVKEYAIQEIDWLGKTQTQAVNEIKDLVIQRYNEIVPNLVNKLNVLETQVKQQKQQQPTKRNLDQSLMDL